MSSNVQGILHDSLTSVGMMRREDSSLSVASLPAIMAPKPFRSRIPTLSNSGRSTPNGSRSDLSKLGPPPIAPKPSKLKLRREISSPPNLNERRGSIDKGRASTPTGLRSKIPTWRGSQEKLNSGVKGQIRKWESSASLEVRLI